MALSPLQQNEELELPIDESLIPAAPSKTYALGTETIGGFIDDEAALRQFIAKAVRTARYRFLIYTDDYGCELDSLIGDDLSPELLQSEIPRILREALIYDDRIQDVVNFEITRESDKLYVNFSVITTDGTNITEEVTF
ncbi:DUF2634 domain-containing protein [Cytobacillus oceanisediminis]|uniref:Terminase n=1 Tax=Cytobacillus oceanisediminis 2691 TaxID=1196031 RepID=A0A169FM32_9BACI|nr:DUF2634 domain-containing protein [Cytobacillus oceanisediminis]AND39625.1 terminase [Cytobacillus oceanisediminis 2691]